MNLFNYVLSKLRGLFVSLGILLISLSLNTTGKTYIHSGNASGEVLARQLLDLSGISGGMIIHLGSDDGTLTASLCAGDNYIVQGLERDPLKVEESRNFIRSKGFYGQVSISHWKGNYLPYAENLVNLIIAEDPDGIRMEEMLRVLAPYGVVLVNKDGDWEKTVKPWPDEIDEWTHYLHSPDNNAVSDDKLVGPPQQMQWVGNPPFARSHEINSSMGGMVTAGGRLFTIEDEGPIGVADPRFPQQWALVARDAFNGMQLWKQPMTQWGWPQWHDETRWDDPRERGSMLRFLPATLPRRLVASDNCIYVTLGYNAPVTVFDAATGKKLNVFEETELTDEILYADEFLVLRVRIPESPPESDFWGTMPDRPKGRIMVVDAESGHKLWQGASEEMAPLTLASSNRKVYYSNYKEIVCLDMASGMELWRSEPVESRSGMRNFGGTLVAKEKVVLYTPLETGNSGHTHAFSAETGEVLWRGPANIGTYSSNPPDLFVADSLVWLSELNPGRVGNDPEMKNTLIERQGLDPVSGNIVRDISVPYLISPGHHYRCYRSKATQNHLLLPKRGVEFLDLKGDDHSRHDWLRAPCIYGVLPANGILYMGPHQCVCYPGVLLSNFNALVSGTSDNIKALPPAPGERLMRGSAYGRTYRHVGTDEKDWPTYRRDSRRSGSTTTSVPDRLETLWEADLGGKVTPPVVSGGRLYVAQKDAHTVYALDARNGSPLWHYTAGARVDSPPTVHGPLVIFGSADGWVYCLWASSGELVWKFMAAPRERHIAAFEQFESVWPVHGSVLVEYDATVSPARPVVYFTAGRSSFIDGGMEIYGLDPFSGEVLYQTSLVGPHEDPFEDMGMPGYMDGAKSDILVSDGADLYLFQNRFRSDLTPIEAPLHNIRFAGGGQRFFPPDIDRSATGKRLITTNGFLDDSFNEGHYWTYSDRWPGWDRLMREVPSYGQLLVFDDHTSYGVNFYTEEVRVRRGFTPGEKGYRMFSREHDVDKDDWSVFMPVRTQAMVLTDERLFFAGTPDVVPDEDPLASFEGRLGAVLWVVSTSTGEDLAAYMLDSPVVFDGLIAAQGKLYFTTTDGHVMCLAEEDIDIGMKK